MAPLHGFRPSRGVVAVVVTMTRATFGAPVTEGEYRSRIESFAAGNGTSSREIIHGIARDETTFRPRLVDDLLADPELSRPVEWLVPGYVARGAMTLVAGHPKAGKSTFLSHLACAVARGQAFLGQNTIPCPVLWVDLEQGPRFTRAMFERVDAAGANIHVFSGSKGIATSGDLQSYIVEHGIGSVVIDSLASFWNIDDENDATAVTEALQSILRIVRDTNAAFVVVHHLRKSGRSSENLDFRGSGAMLALADIAVAFRRAAKKSSDLEYVGTRRELLATSRMPETPDQLLVDFRDGVFLRLGTPSQVRSDDFLARILDTVADRSMSIDEIAEATGKSKAQVSRTTRDGHQRGLLQRAGKGKSGDPYRFSRYPAEDAENVSSHEIPDGKTKRSDADLPKNSDIEMDDAINRVSARDSQSSEAP